jgi:hypothetical protein
LSEVHKGFPDQGLLTVFSPEYADLESVRNAIDADRFGGNSGELGYPCRSIQGRQ